MSYKTTRKADQDIIDIYVRGLAEFGVDQAERYHQGVVSIFDAQSVVHIEDPRTVQDVASRLEGFVDLGRLAKVEEGRKRQPHIPSFIGNGHTVCGYMFAI